VTYDVLHTPLEVIYEISHVTLCVEIIAIYAVAYNYRR